MAVRTSTTGTLTTGTLTAGLLMALLAGPALADCAEEISSLESEINKAATGDAATTSDLPATQHQQEVMEGIEETPDSTTATAADSLPGAAEAPVTEHQQDVTGIGGGGETDVVALLDQAKQQAEAGEEQACMESVAAIKSQIGMN